jgi:excisionase family DNA binding protein
MHIEGTPERLLTLYLPEPIGWVAVTCAELRAAQARAAELVGQAPFGTGRPSDAGPSEARTLLTPAEAARVLSVDASWLLRRAREGALPHVRLGKYIRFSPEAIVGQCTKPAKPAR